MKNNMTLSIRLAAPLVALTLAGAACGSSGGSSEAELIEWFEGQGETSEAAACFAKELSSYSTDDLDAFDTADSPDDLPTELVTDVMTAAEACADL